MQRQVWFIIFESIASACYGVARHVGERLSPKEICGSFEKMYKIFFRYLELGDQQKHFRFAYVWNEVCTAYILDNGPLCRCKSHSCVMANTLVNHDGRSRVNGELLKTVVWYCKCVLMAEKRVVFDPFWNLIYLVLGGP